MLKEMTRDRVIEEVLEDGETITAPTYQVILHNDDVTPVPLVLMVLVSVFQLDTMESINKINEAERKDKAKIKGGYSFSEAIEKVEESDKMCEKIGFKLQFTIEEE